MQQGREGGTAAALGDIITHHVWQTQLTWRAAEEEGAQSWGCAALSCLGELNTKLGLGQSICQARASHQPRQVPVYVNGGQMGKGKCAWAHSTQLLETPPHHLMPFMRNT